MPATTSPPRGNERKAIFRDDIDRFHFLELLGEATERHVLQVHAYVLMDNHFHLLVQTPEANLSRAMQWLGASYSVWFNRRHDRGGHLFQGRFKGLVVQDDAGWQEVARCQCQFSLLKQRQGILRQAFGLGRFGQQVGDISPTAHL